MSCSGVQNFWDANSHVYLRAQELLDSLGVDFCCMKDVWLQFVFNSQQQMKSYLGYTCRELCLRFPCPGITGLGKKDNYVSEAPFVHTEQLIMVLSDSVIVFPGCVISSLSKLAIPFFVITATIKISSHSGVFIKVFTELAKMPGFHECCSVQLVSSVTWVQLRVYHTGKLL